MRFTKKRSRSRALALLLATAMVILLIPAGSASAADIVPITAGETVTAYSADTTTPWDVWFLFTAKEDGLYKFTARHIATGAFNMLFYDRDGQKQFTSYFISDSGTEAITKISWEEKSIYLHSGSYLIDCNSYSYNADTRYVTFTVESVPLRFGGTDKEPNNSKDATIPLAVNGKAAGALRGNFDDGTRDEEDWYAINIPSAGKYSFLLESEFQNSLTIYDAEMKAVSFSALGETTDLYDTLDKLYRLEKTKELPAGKYYICVKFFSAGSGFSYQLIEGDGTASAPAAPAAPGVPALTGAAVNTGVRLTLPKLTTGVGWRIYRSETRGAEGSVIASLVTSPVYI
ncbi:MAG: hypothetical protein LBT12_02275, partial [Oscillospiraceae bacterium]|nr:hypothetical protein [Oscillospiraceae bacterium]